MLTQEYKTIALVGQGSSGKSTIFRVLSDIKSPDFGSTYEVDSALVNSDIMSFRLVDLPGVYSLNPTQPAEEITLRYLMNRDVDLIINVVDAFMLSRSLELTIELAELGLPMVIALNMLHEAEKNGITIDCKKLSEITGVPVVPVQAIRGKGMKDLVDACAMGLISGRATPEVPVYTHHVEMAVKALEHHIRPELFDLKGGKRFYAVKCIENPGILPASLPAGVKKQIDEIGRQIFSNNKMKNFEAISYERHHLAMKTSEEICTMSREGGTSLAERLDTFLLHPVAGYPALALFFFLYFLIIFTAGNFLGKLIEAPLDRVTAMLLPLKSYNSFLWYSIGGAWQGVVGAVGIVLPYFVPLVLLTSIFEETGYMNRIAFLIDGLMHKMGLHGKSVVPFILGFGCSVPAIYSTRMLENKFDRTLTSILIPFIPCSARITVIFALAAAFTGPVWAVIIYAYVIFIIGLTGRIISRTLARPIGMILEMPRLKQPSITVSLRKTWGKTRDFLREALLFLTLGGVVLGWIEFFKLNIYIDRLLSPVVHITLGLPEQLGSTLLFGFFRKELILVMAGQAMGVASFAQLPLSAEQIVVFIIFITLYFPCLSTFIVLLREFGIKTAVYAGLLSLIVATLSGLLFKLLLALH